MNDYLEFFYLNKVPVTITMQDKEIIKNVIIEGYNRLGISFVKNSKDQGSNYFFVPYSSVYSVTKMSFKNVTTSSESSGGWIV